MNKDVLKIIAIAALTAPAGALAQAPDWTYAEVSYLSSEFDEDALSDVEPDGFELKGEVGYIDVGDFFDGEGFFEIDGIYTLDMGLGFGLSYREIDELETFTATARYAFR